MMADVAARIRAARAYADLTRRELAEQLGVSESTIQRREHGQQPDPRRQELMAIAQVCSVPLAFLEHGFHSNVNHHNEGEGGIL
jgi:transcriptional regulator with XRE-family HTH domain